MLSIITCSISPEYVQRLLVNIQQTAALEYEIIVYENDGHKGLCEVYNICAAKAKYPNLCFVHEDVLFHTIDWDKLIAQYLCNEQIGVLGVMGGRYKSAFGLSWKDGKTSFYRFNIMDGIDHKHLSYFPKDEILSEVVCLDGAFLCCRKDVWEKFRFDEEHFKGFHFYDIDFSFRVAQLYRNYTINNLLLEHFSQGKFDKNFIKDLICFEEIHQQTLPFTIEKISKKEISQLEGYALTEKLRLLKKNNFSLLFRLQLLQKYLRRHFNFYQLSRNVYFGFVKS